MVKICKPRPSPISYHMEFSKNKLGIGIMFLLFITMFSFMSIRLVVMGNIYSLLSIILIIPISILLPYITRECFTDEDFVLIIRNGRTSENKFLVCLSWYGLLFILVYIIFEFLYSSNLTS